MQECMGYRQNLLDIFQVDTVWPKVDVSFKIRSAHIYVAGPHDRHNNCASMLPPAWLNTEQPEQHQLARSRHHSDMCLPIFWAHWPPLQGHLCQHSPFESFSKMGDWFFVAGCCVYKMETGEIRTG
jgi:hypothetical protein